MREKLIELLGETVADCMPTECLDEIADHLIANGVTISPCKVGDTVYVFYSRVEYKTRYGSRRRQNTQIYTNHHLQWAIREKAVEIREKKCTKGDMNLFGRLVFLSREDAEAEIRPEPPKGE